MTNLRNILADERRWNERLELAQPCPHCGLSMLLHSDSHGWYLEHPDNECIHSATQILDDADLTSWNRRT